MKRLVFTLFLSVCMISCGRFVTPIPFDIEIYVCDSDGNNLVDPDFEGNILDDGLTVEYKGDLYPLGAGRVNNMAFDARTTGGYSSLVFGIFSTDDDMDSFVINWGDGTADEIGFDFGILWLNGEKVSDGSKDWYAIKIVK